MAGRVTKWLRIRAALTTTQPQPTEVAGELWLLDGSGA